MIREYTIAKQNKNPPVELVVFHFRVKPSVTSLAKSLTLRLPLAKRTANF